RPHAEGRRGGGHRRGAGFHQPAAAPVQAGLCPGRPHHGRDGAEGDHRPLRGRQAPGRPYQPPAVAGNVHEPALRIVSRTDRPEPTDRARSAMNDTSYTPYTEFLPICRADMEARGWDQLDFVVVGGDAYVDHPSFG